MEKLAIVILNWNGQKMLQKYLSPVLQYSKDEATVYVADNASTDDSLKMLREEFPSVKERGEEATNAIYDRIKEGAEAHRAENAPAAADTGLAIY